jgi:hypothetical protein
LWDAEKRGVHHRGSRGAAEIAERMEEGGLFLGERKKNAGQSGDSSHTKRGIVKRWRSLSYVEAPDYYQGD